MTTASRIVLGSRSPRRRELLSLLVDPSRIDVVPPRDAAEPGFEGLVDWPAIEARLREIVRGKSEDVVAQVGPGITVLTADTTIVVEPPARRGECLVLGQPPEDGSWPDVVRGWFRDHYLGRTHTAATAVRCVRPDGSAAERVVTTRVTFIEADDDLVEWYLATGEPRGKAGGYGLQGAGSVFVAGIEGSPSNVIGLPLRETRELLAAA